MIFSVTSSCLQLLIHLDVHRCSYYMNVKMQNYINVNTTARLRPPFRFGAQAFEAQWLDKRWTRFVFLGQAWGRDVPSPKHISGICCSKLRSQPCLFSIFFRKVWPTSPNMMFFFFFSPEASTRTSIACQNLWDFDCHVLVQAQQSGLLFGDFS